MKITNTRNKNFKVEVHNCAEKVLIKVKKQFKLVKYSDPIMK